jgi:hypothetical protein
MYIVPERLTSDGFAFTDMMRVAQTPDPDDWRR